MKKTSTRNIDMINGPLLENLIIFAFPLMLSNLMQSLFNVTDTVIVGKYAGDLALAAVGATGSLSFFIISLFGGVSMGATVVVAQLIGKGNREKIHDSVETSYALALICGFAVAMIGIFGSRFLLELMNTPEDIIDLSALYMKIYFSGSLFNIIYNFGSAILRANGDTKRPLYFLVASGITNVVLNLLFVRSFHMSVAGVALSTAIAQFVSAALATITLIRSQDVIHLEVSEIRLNVSIALDILRVGIPAGIQSMMYSISNVVMQSSMNSFDSSDVIAGNTIGANIENFAYIGMYSFSQACITFTSQNYGAGNYEKLRKIMRMTLALCVSAALAMSCLLYLIRYPLMSLYTSSETVMEMASLRIKLVVLTIFLNGVLDIFVGSLRGMGASAGPTILMVIGICGVRLAWLLLYFPHNPQLYVIYLSFPLSWTVTSIIEYILWLFNYRRMMRTVRAREAI